MTMCMWWRRKASELTINTVILTVTSIHQYSSVRLGSSPPTRSTTAATMAASMAFEGWVLLGSTAVVELTMADLDRRPLPIVRLRIGGGASPDGGPQGRVLRGIEARPSTGSLPSPAFRSDYHIKSSHQDRKLPEPRVCLNMLVSLCCVPLLRALLTQACERQDQRQTRSVRRIF